MAVTKNEKEALLKTVIPKAEVGDSGYVVKDKHFTKEKTFINTKKETEEKIEVDYRRLSIGREQMVLHKGVQLTKYQLDFFDEKSKAYWLEYVGGDKKPKAKKSATKAKGTEPKAPDTEAQD